MKYMSVSTYISPPHAKTLRAEASGLSKSRVKKKSSKNFAFCSQMITVERPGMNASNTTWGCGRAQSVLLQFGTPSKPLGLIYHPLTSPGCFANEKCLQIDTGADCCSAFGWVFSVNQGASVIGAGLFFFFCQHLPQWQGWWWLWLCAAWSLWGQSFRYQSHGTLPSGGSLQLEMLLQIQATKRWVAYACLEN